MADSVAQPEMPDAPENAGFDDPGHGPWWMETPAEPVNSGGYPIVPDDPSGTGGHPIVADDPSNTGGFPIPRDDPSNTGGFPMVRDDPSNTGGFPVLHDEPVASGGFPIVTDEALASGGYPAAPQQMFNSGGYPIIQEGSLTSGGYPVMPSDKVKKTRSKAGILGAVFAAGVGLLIILVAGYMIFRTDDGAPAPVQKKRIVAAAAVAGGLNKTTTIPAATAAYPFVMAGIRAAGLDGPGNAMGVYSAPVVGPQELLFVGGAADTDDPAAFVRKVKPSTALTTTNVAPGGQAVCGTFQVLSDVHVYCAWATRGSFGVIATNLPTPIPDTAGMAGLMAKMRADLDKRF
jgi:hypothetical protein